MRVAKGHDKARSDRTTRYLRATHYLVVVAWSTWERSACMASLTSRRSEVRQISGPRADRIENP